MTFAISGDTKPWVDPKTEELYKIMPDLQRVSRVLVDSHLSVYENGDAAYGNFNGEHDDWPVGFGIITPFSGQTVALGQHHARTSGEDLLCMTLVYLQYETQQ